MSLESIRNSVAGVAIAVALVPPLAVVGIGIALGHRATADVGLSFREVGLFSGGTDVAVGGISAFRDEPDRDHRRSRHRDDLPGLRALALLMQPLNDEFDKLRAKSMALRLTEKLPVTHPEIFQASRLHTLRVRYQDDVLHLHAESFVPRERVEGGQRRLDLFRQELEEKIGEPVVIEVEAMPVDILHFRSAQTARP